MLQIVKTLFEIVNKAPRYAVALVGSAVLVSVPEHIAERLDVADFAKNYRGVFWVVFVLSTAYCLVEVAAFLVRRLGGCFRRRKAEKRLVQRLHGLTEEEKQIVRFYVYHQTRTNFVRLDDGVVNGMVADGLLVRSGPIGRDFDGVAHNINQFVWEYLNIHTRLLDGETDIIRTDRCDEIF